MLLCLISLNTPTEFPISHIMVKLPKTWTGRHVKGKLRFPPSCAGMDAPGFGVARTDYRAALENQSSDTAVDPPCRREFANSVNGRRRGGKDLVVGKCYSATWANYSATSLA